MAKVVGDDAPRAGFTGELDQGFVIRVREQGPPAGFQRPFLRAGANGVEQGIHVPETEAEFHGVGLENLLVFMQQVIAENDPPAVLTQCDEHRKRLPQPGTKRGEEDVGVHHGTGHGVTGGAEAALVIDIAKRIRRTGDSSTDPCRTAVAPFPRFAREMKCTD